MRIGSSTRCDSGLDDQFVEVAKKGVEAQANQRVQRCVVRRAWKKDAEQTIRWLHEIESVEALPVMRAIAKAEKVSGHRLIVRIDDDLVLCSRGFRIPTNWKLTPLSPLVDFTTYRLRSETMRWASRLVAEGEGIKDRVKKCLRNPDFEDRLLYQGLDEWPTIGKLCWWARL